MIGPASLSSFISYSICIASSSGIRQILASRSALLTLWHLRLYFFLHEIFLFQLFMQLPSSPFKFQLVSLSPYLFAKDFPVVPHPAASHFAPGSTLGEMPCCVLTSCPTPEAILGEMPCVSPSQH